MTRFAANLLLQYGVRESPSPRPLCERRIVVFEASTVKAAIRRAKQLGRRAQLTYRNADGQIFEIKFIGLIDVLSLEHARPEEAYHSMRRTTRPERHVRSDDQLSAARSLAGTLRSSWWAVPDWLAKPKAKSKGLKRGA